MEARGERGEKDYQGGMEKKKNSRLVEQRKGVRENMAAGIFKNVKDSRTARKLTRNRWRWVKRQKLERWEDTGISKRSIPGKKIGDRTDVQMDIQKDIERKWAEPVEGGEGWCMEQERRDRRSSIVFPSCGSNQLQDLQTAINPDKLLQMMWLCKLIPDMMFWTTFVEVTFF